MRFLALILILFSLAGRAWAQADAGPDKIVSSTKGTKIGKPGNPNYCYHWEATPADPSLTAAGDAQPEVHPTQTTTYKLTVTTTDFGSITTDEVTVYKLSIDYFRHAQTGKAWKVVVGENIEYKATASNNCTDWKWELKNGIYSYWSLENGNSNQGANMYIPYTNLILAKNNDFGSVYGEVAVSCKDVEGNVYEVSSLENNSTELVKVFFDPEKDIFGSSPGTLHPPCWFVFWKEGAVPGLEDFSYAHEDYYGESEVLDLFGLNIMFLKVGQKAGGVHYSKLILGGVNYAGATGIDCCAEVVAHEKRHNELQLELLAGEADNDPPDPLDPDLNFIGDRLPDKYEAGLGCDVTNKDTYDLEHNKAAGYKYYGDNEFAAIVAGYGIKGIASLDWSKGGKQW